VPQLQQKLALNVLNIHNTFLYNLQMGPQRGLLHYTWQKRLAKDKPSSLLVPLISYEENLLLYV